MQQGMALLFCLQIASSDLPRKLGASSKQTTLSESLHDTQLKYLVIINDHSPLVLY